MKKTALLLIASFCIFILGCGDQSPKAAADKPGTPGPLKEGAGTASLPSLYSKRLAGSGLVEELYKDMTEKKPELQSLESQMRWLYAAANDSTATYNAYLERSTRYYNSANSVLGRVRDSVLRQRLQLLLNASRDKFENKTNRFSILIANTNAETDIMEDYHNILKLVATLSVMEHYQDASMPDIKPVKKLSDEATRIRVKTQQLVKKYGGD